MAIVSGSVDQTQAATQIAGVAIGERYAEVLARLRHRGEPAMATNLRSPS